LRKPFLFLLFFFIYSSGISQENTPASISMWIDRLSSTDDPNNAWYDSLATRLAKMDSAGVFTFLKELEHTKGAKSNYFTARFNCLKTENLYWRNLNTSGVLQKPETVKKEIKGLLTAAMNAAYECNDDHLIALVSGCYGSVMLSLGETEPAVTYLTNAIDLNKKFKRKETEGMYIALGEIMWNIREYDKCISYTQLGLLSLISSTADTFVQDLYTMFCSNTIGLAFQKLGRYDSAFFYYNRALQVQPKVDRPVWRGIILGNMAQIYFLQGKYETALSLFETDFTLSKQFALYDNAGNARQWAARTNLALGKKDSALLQVREALGLLQNGPQANYRRNAYYTASEVFKALNNTDSSFYYAGLYTKIHDSIERVVYQSGVNIARLRLAEEKNRYNILNLQKEKQDQVKQRNYIIAGIVVLSCFVLLLVNRRNQQLKYKQLLNEQEKRRTEQEMQAAKEQLQMFTQNLVEKTALIEKLEQQMQENSASAGQQETITELSNLTILTEAEWDQFKTLFEKNYPRFFQRLKTKAPDITAAEQRMAALTRLQLTTRQMASMQGISPDSVHKTRQRLRQRLGVSNEVNLEEYFSQV
jgi:tetratricopeptide (TPR) repeat protein